MKRSKAEIVQHIREAVEVVSLGNVPAERLRESDDLLAQLRLDSMDYASVLLRCETWMQIRVREENVDWRRIRTVEQLAQFLEDQQE